MSGPEFLAFIATEKTGRICRGVELDPLYVDVIVRRFEAVTGHCNVKERAPRRVFEL
jgi:DNA modification methylase